MPATSTSRSAEPPLFRMRGTVVRAKMAPFTYEQVVAMFNEVMSPAQQEELAELGGADFAYSIKGVGRFQLEYLPAARQLPFHGRAHRQNRNSYNRAAQSAAQRQDAVHLRIGIGAGRRRDRSRRRKSTTLASIIEIINQTQKVHIVTLENPIEYLYHDKKAFINQREIGIDLPDFANGLRHVMRQDPDVILVGEMRDAPTIEAALLAAETGHLVFGTIHCGSASQSIGRILDYFPPDRHHQIRQLLYFNLRAVVVQKLLKGRKPETPRIPCVEIIDRQPVDQEK